MSSGGDAAQNGMEGLDKQAIMSKLMADPSLMNMMQAKLAGLEGAKSDFFASLPTNIKNRVYAVRNLQKEHMNIEADFYSKMNELERKFEAQYNRIYEKRANILSGDHEPSAMECEHTDDEEAEEAKDTSNGEMKTDAVESPYAADAKGIPEFWLSVLKSARATEGLIEPHDENILKHLTNITCTVLPESKNDEGLQISSFKLDFHFSKNEYFNHDVITKTYTLRARPDADAILAYEGPEVDNFDSTKIEWSRKELDPCKKIVKKKQTNKKTGQTRVVEKSETQDSFFSFFQQIDERKFLTEDDDEDEEYDQTEAILEADYEIGHFIRERIIPRAVLFFTGEIQDDEDDDYEDEEGDEEMDEMLQHDGSGSDEDPDFDPSTVKQQPECKQQ